ncbi:VOC family protein [Actinomadura sp. LD22]|uniref:VOC family protein n=1 Tax=Actinomadura physcomitrii TaxID=2650748 RepID=A0A6I4M689_9ACTN|nr:VOC family protein [Actinomadura physcomitrii]MVZ99844.1 VOC family protein [Actinomadura physcomitrii]
MTGSGSGKQGSVDQLGFVVEDIEATMRYWNEVLGVGPFFYLERSATTNLFFRGEKTSVVSSTALAQAGGVQIELVQLRNDAPSAYRDMHPHGPGALHHVGYFVDDYEATLKAEQDKGLELVQWGDAGPRVHFCYLADPKRQGLLVELIEIGGLRDFFDRIAEAGRTWDGTDGILKIKPSL